MPNGSSGSRLPVGRSLYARSVLVDTSALLALANHQDNYHPDALDCLNAIANQRLPLFVSTPTIYESQRRFLYDLGQTAARHFLIQIFDGSVNILRPGEQDEQEATRLLDRYGGLRLTFTDVANMALMTRFGIAAAFSFDWHYLTTGFIRIPPFHL